MTDRSPTLLQRIRHGRGTRKLLRDRMAMAALAVITAYFGFAFLVLAFGLIGEEATVEKVGPRNLPGVWEAPSFEKRLEFAQFRLEEVERATKADDAAAALDELRFAEVRTADLSVEEFRDRVASAWEHYDAIETVEAEADAEALRKLAGLEAEVDGLFTGRDGLAYRLRTLLGTDRQGRSILVRGLYAIKVAVQIGVISALIAVAIGALLGGMAGYFGGWVDHAVVWLYSTFSSIPWIVLLMVLASMFRGTRFDGTLLPVYAAFCISFWISPCRVIRGEVMKLRELEYVQAASAIGFGRMRILLKHVLPNTAHLMFINFSLLFIGAVKAEVILSFLGLGVKNEPSWGVMINHARQEVINGFFWQIGTATALMLVLVLAFNVLSDALQDAFDPKHV